jgi:hypothetical protein
MQTERTSGKNLKTVSLALSTFARFSSIQGVGDLRFASSRAINLARSSLREMKNGTRAWLIKTSAKIIMAKETRARFCYTQIRHLDWNYYSVSIFASFIFLLDFCLFSPSIL